MEEESKNFSWKTKLLFVIGGVGFTSLGLAWFYKKGPFAPKVASSKSPDSIRAGDNNNSSIAPGKSEENLEELSSDPYEKAIQLKNKGNKYFRGGKFDKAIECYSEAIEVCPVTQTKDLATFYQNRAAARDTLHQYQLVEDDCSQALQHDPRYEKALARRGRARESLEKYRDALEDFTAVCILENFSNADNLQRADRVLKSLGRQLAKETLKSVEPCLPGSAFLRAFFSAFSEDPAQTAELGEDAVVPVLEAFKQSRYEEVLGLCDEALRADLSEDRRQLCVLVQATFQMLSGRTTEARASLDALIDSGDTGREIKANALIKRASLRMQNVAPNDAEAVSAEVLGDFDLALVLCPDHPDVYHHRGQMMLITDRTGEALSDLSKASQMCPNNPIPSAQKAYAAHRSGDPGAITELKNLCAKFETCSEAFSLYGQALVDSQNYTDADRVFESITKLERDSGTAFVHRGLLRLQAFNDGDGAINLMKKAIEVEPKCEFALETLATVEVQRGNLKEATELFERAIKLTKTEAELSHLISLREAALTQLKLSQTMGLRIPSLSNFMA